MNISIEQLNIQIAFLTTLRDQQLVLHQQQMLNAMPPLEPAIPAPVAAPAPQRRQRRQRSRRPRCEVILSRGKNKGQRCPNASYDEGKCRKHAHAANYRRHDSDDDSDSDIDAEYWERDRKMDDFDPVRRAAAPQVVVAEPGAAACAECAICMSGMAPNQPRIYLPCAHSFHQKCGESWLRIKPECPLCRHMV